MECKNRPEMDPDSQSLMQLADAAGNKRFTIYHEVSASLTTEVRTQQQQQAAVHLLEHFEGPHGRTGKNRTGKR